MQIVGLDIGGANLKAADADENSQTRSFPVWKYPERLSNELQELLTHFPQAEAIALTMTAELADCFETKAEGVDAILRSVEEAAQGKPIVVWQTGAEFVTPDVAREIPLLVAAANWHGLATWLGRMVPREGAVMIDIGTTTTDLIPLSNGVPVSQGFTDRERLQFGELVYTGVRRTPVCSLARVVPFAESEIPLAAELFATTLDLYLLLAEIPEEPDNRETANGKPATVSAAHDRLARMLCCDRQELSLEAARNIARFLADVQQQQITAALQRVLDEMEQACTQVLISGSGDFLAEKIVSGHPELRSAEILRLRNILSRQTSEAACAFALARLASERAAGLL